MREENRPRTMHNLRHLNRVTTGLSYLLRRDRVWGQPVFFTIETINSCNFRCIYCPQSDQEHHFINGRGIMSLEDFKQIIANLRSCFDVRIVSLHRDGEPLLNKRLEAYIQHLTDLGIYVTVSSNCSLVSEERAHRLVESGLRMVGTDFCADPALYERLRARGVWTETLDGIRRLLRAGAEQNADFRIVIKDMATHGASPKDAESLMARAEEIWNGERMVNLRRALTEKRPQDIGICKACDVPWQGSYSGRTSLEKVRNFFFAGAWRR